MPVQRVFSAKGFGTIATGIPLSGRVEPGDALEVLCGDAPPRPARVRGLQAYGRPIAAGAAGHSTALNLAKVERADLKRGAVVATPDVFWPGALWEVQIETLASSRPLETTQEVRVHLGTAEVLGQVVLLETPQLAPGALGLAQLRLRSAIVAAPGDRFVLRRASPLETIAGGVVLARSRWRLKRGKRQAGERVAARAAALGDLPAQAACELREVGGELRRGSSTWREAAGGLGVAGDALDAALRDLASQGEARELEPGWFMTLERSSLEDTERAALERALGEALANYHAQRPTRAACPLNDLRTRLQEAGCEAPLERLSAVLKAAVEGGSLSVSDQGYALAAHVPSLPPAWEEIAARARALAAEDGVQPRARQRLAQCASPDAPAAGEDVIAHLVEAGALVALDDVVVTRATWVQSEAAVLALLEEGAATVAAARDRLGANRRYAVALLEDLDRRGLTLREGDRRLRAPGSS